MSDLRDFLRDVGLLEFVQENQFNCHPLAERVNQEILKRLQFAGPPHVYHVTNPGSRDEKEISNSFAAGRAAFCAATGVPWTPRARESEPRLVVVDDLDSDFRTDPSSDGGDDRGHEGQQHQSD